MVEGSPRKGHALSIRESSDCLHLDCVVLNGLMSQHRSAGGPERWRVICCAAGGRHNLVLALPDNSDSDRAQRSQCSPVRRRLHDIIPVTC